MKSNIMKLNKIILCFSLLLVVGCDRTFQDGQTVYIKGLNKEVVIRYYSVAHSQYVVWYTNSIGQIIEDHLFVEELEAK
jgi:hypothetical protein